MNKSASITRNLAIFITCVLALTSVAGCGYWFAAVARQYRHDALDARDCAEKHAPPGDPAAQAAAKKAQEATHRAFQVFRSNDEFFTYDDLTATSAAAAEAADEASKVPGCNLEMAKRRLDGKYNQEIFGVQGPPS